MEFCFYPNHEHGCPSVKHCPHLGGAPLETTLRRRDSSQTKSQTWRARAMASFLRNDIGVSLRKVPRVLEELLELSFVPATLLNLMV